MPREGRTTPEEDRERAERIRAKQERGEELTREEAGFLGAVASMRTTRKERKEAEREGREEEFEEEHRVESWTNAPEKARAPHVSREAREKAERLREKQERGEQLSREEAGFLGGFERAKDASRED